MNIDAWIAIAVTVGIFAMLQLRRNVPTDLLFLFGMMVVTLAGVITPAEAFAGLASTAVLTIGSLLVVAAGLRVTGVLDWIGHRWLGRFKSERTALLALAVGLVSTSAFLLNTALVAMAMPVVLDWCRKRGISPSRLLMPVSYLAILGGVCTLIGTSTTLVLNDMLKVEYQSRKAEVEKLEQEKSDQDNHAEDPSQEQMLSESRQHAEQVRPLGLFEIGKAGLPCALVGTLVLIFWGRRLLPNRTELVERLGDQRREYLVEMLVQRECPLIGLTVERAGLRHLPGLYLIEIDRGEDVITPVTPQDVIRPDDRLIFTGVVSTILDLERIPGLVPAADTTYEFHPTQRQQRHLTEVVLSRTCPLIGTTVREGNFRQRYNAAVVAVHRNGVRLTNKIGNIQLEAGDTLLLQTRSEFVSNFRNNLDFYLVSGVEGDEPRRHDRARLAGGLALILVGLLIFISLLAGQLQLGTGLEAAVAMAVALMMVVTRCLRIADARAAIDLQLLLTIVGALAMGRALTVSGAADAVAGGMVQLVGSENPWMLLIVLYLLTMIFTELITNNAVVAMLFPLAVAVAADSGHHPRPFIIAIALASSLAFITPIGYQTNLMVMGPGGYRPRDYLRSGVPVSLLVALTAMILIPRFWPF